MALLPDVLHWMSVFLLQLCNCGHSLKSSYWQHSYYTAHTNGWVSSGLATHPVHHNDPPLAQTPPFEKQHLNTTAEQLFSLIFATFNLFLLYVQYTHVSFHMPERKMYKCQGTSETAITVAYCMWLRVHRCLFDKNMKTTRKILPGHTCALIQDFQSVPLRLLLFLPL